MLVFCAEIRFYCIDSHTIQEVAVNKAELIEAVAGTSGLHKREAEAALEATIYQITTTVRSGGSVRVIGFGSFRPRDRKARKGRNPQTGAAVQIKASKGISFAPGATLKRELNARAQPPKPKPLPSRAGAATGGRATAAAKAPAKAAATKATKTAAAAKTTAKKAVKKVAAPVKKATRSAKR